MTDAMREMLRAAFAAGAAHGADAAQREEWGMRAGRTEEDAFGAFLERHDAERPVRRAGCASDICGHPAVR